MPIRIRHLELNLTAVPVGALPGAGPVGPMGGALQRRASPLLSRAAAAEGFASTIGLRAPSRAAGDSAGGGVGAVALQRRVARAKGPAIAGAAPGVGALMGRSRGEPLPLPVRGSLESLLGADFADVRVHRDGAAAQAARAIQAEAFTHGEHVYFGHGAYDPGSRAGQALLGHELTHVVQQRGGADRVAASRGLTVAPHDRLEEQALAVERRILSGAVSLGGTARTEALGGAIYRKAQGGGMLRRSLLRRMFGGGSDGALVARSSGPGKCEVGRLDLVWADAREGSPGGGPSMAVAGQARGSGATAGMAPAGFEGLVAASAGTSLPQDVAAQMGALLDLDAAAVRVHADRAAALAAEAIGAQAFTLGEEVFFNAGRYAPHSAQGLALLAHELTHVAQNQGGAPTLQAADGVVSRKSGGAQAEAFAQGIAAKGMVVAGHDRLERQAEANEAAVYRGLTGGGLHTIDHQAGAPMAAGVARGYPGALAFKLEDEGGAGAAPPGVVDPDVENAVQLFRDVASGLGAAADIGIGFVPIVGDVYDVLCGLVGRALFTWEHLDIFERLLCIVGVIPIPFVSGGLLRRGAGALRRVLSERRAVQLFNWAVGRATGFVKRNLARVRSWFNTSRLTAPLRAAAAVPGQVLSLATRLARKFESSKRGGDAVVAELREEVEQLEALIAKAAMRTNAQSYFEFKALRMQGYSAQAAHDLMKRFRQGDAVEGFAYHFTDRVGGRGITNSNRLRAGKGVAGHGVYAGSTPTPGALQMRGVWGLSGERDVRIPIRMGEGKEAYEAVYPTKSYLFEVTEDMPLAGGIEHIARRDPALRRLWERYWYTVLMAGGTIAGLGSLASMLFKREDRVASMALAGGGIGSRRLLQGGAGENAAAWLEEWGQLDRSERDRLSFLVERLTEVDQQPGLPLEWSVRQRLEGALGEDLSRVRTYSGTRAEDLARTLEAQAFTVNERIVFGGGAFAPDSIEGMGTLVHEATHAVQAEQGRIPEVVGEQDRRTLEAEAYGRERSYVARASRGAATRAAPELEVRSEAASSVDEAPAAQPRLAVPPALSRSLAKAVDGRAKPAEADAVQRVMDSWRVAGMTREEFLEDCKERLLDLLHDEVELDNERRETLAWNPYLPQA